MPEQEVYVSSTRVRDVRFWIGLTVITVLFLAASLLLLVVEIGRAHGRATSLAPIRNLGGKIVYNHDAPRWLNDILGNDFLSSVVAVDLSYTSTSDADLTHLVDILRGLKGFHSLLWVRLSHTQVTANGVHEFQKMLPDVKVYHPAGDPMLEGFPGKISILDDTLVIEPRTADWRQCQASPNRPSGARCSPR